MHARSIALLALAVGLLAGDAAKPAQPRTSAIPLSHGVRVPSQYGLHSDQVAISTMSDNLLDGQLGASAGASCSYLPRRDHTNGPAPANASQLQLIYFVPADVAARNWDRPVLCSDGTKRESNIGYAMHNMRRWMGSRPNTAGTQGARMIGKSFNALLRTDSLYGRTTNSYNVMFVRGLYPDAWYSQGNSFDHVINEIDDVFNQPNVKYLVFADVRATDGSGGRAEMNGNHGAIYRRFVYEEDGTDGFFRWGCADEGDAAAMHETLHMWNAVAPGVPDSDGDAHIVATQPSDVMAAVIQSTLNGQWSGNTAAPVSIWDQASDSYTGRVLSFPAYLGSTPGSGLHDC